MRCGCRVLPPPLELSQNRQNRNPHKPPAQLCCSPPYRPHHPWSTQQKLHLTLEYPMAYPGLATLTLAGLGVLWLPSAACSSGNLHSPAKPQAPQTSCPALPQPLMQAPPYLLHTAEAAFYHAVPHGLLRSEHPLTGRALCAVVAECCLLFSTKSPLTGKTATPTNHHLLGPAAAPVPDASHLLHSAEATFYLAVPRGMPRAGHPHTGRARCAVVAECCLLLWNSPQTSKTTSSMN